MNWEIMQKSKNLLAFSGGVDSTALFFILQEKKIPFDIAIVNYNTRKESILELQYAKELAKKYNLKIYEKTINEPITSNFEASARKLRYDFFEEIIANYHYDVLLTAHQLNDNLEWFLMQLSRGSGLVSLIGLEPVSYKNGYKIIRPLLEQTKAELQEYLKFHKHQYFVDSSNVDMAFKRNYFRHKYSDSLIDEFGIGIKKSFEYLRRDRQNLLDQIKKIHSVEALDIFWVQDPFVALTCIDLELKKRGILITYETKQEILKQKQITISDKFCVALDGSWVWICPKSLTSMDKKFKDSARLAKIPQNIRPYLKEILGEYHEIKKFIGSFASCDSLFLDK